MNENDKDYSFVCWKCKKVTYYNIDDLLSSSTELLLEKVTMTPPKKTDYFLNCENPQCGVRNKIILD